MKSTISAVQRKLVSKYLVNNKDETNEKSTNINILLNRVKLTKKIEFKKRLIFLSLLILFITLVGILSLI